MYTDAVDGLLVTATARVLVGFGWTTFIALVRKQVSQIVITEVGALPTVDTLRMSPSRATILAVTSLGSTYCRRTAVCSS